MWDTTEGKSKEHKHKVTARRAALTPLCGNNVIRQDGENAPTLAIVRQGNGWGKIALF